MLADAAFTTISFDDYVMRFPLCYNIVGYTIQTPELSGTTVSRDQSCEEETKCRVFKVTSNREVSWTFTINFVIEKTDLISEPPDAYSKQVTVNFKRALMQQSDVWVD